MMVSPEAESVKDREIDRIYCFICQKDGDGKLFSRLGVVKIKKEARIFQQQRTISGDW